MITMVWRRIAADGGGMVYSVTPEIVADLQLRWMVEHAMGVGTGDPDTCEDAWIGSSAYTMVQLGIDHIIGMYYGYEYDQVTNMLYLKNQVNLSLNHPEIVGIYLNDYYFTIKEGVKTYENYREAINYIKTVNPSLKTYIAYAPLMEADPHIDTILSQISFDAVFCQMRLGQGIDVEGMDAFLQRTEAKFARKQVWGTLLLADQTGTALTDAQARRLIEINRQHYDAGRIEGMRVQYIDTVMSNPTYLQMIQDVYFSEPKPLLLVLAILGLAGIAYMVARR